MQASEGGGGVLLIEQTFFLKFTNRKFNVNILELQIGYDICLKLFCRQVGGGLLFETDIFLKFTYRKI